VTKFERQFCVTWSNNSHGEENIRGRCEGKELSDRHGTLEATEAVPSGTGGEGYRLAGNPGALVTPSRKVEDLDECKMR
jgi:hypothetical protein